MLFLSSVLRALNVVGATGCARSTVRPYRGRRGRGGHLNRDKCHHPRRRYPTVSILYPRQFRDANKFCLFTIVPTRRKFRAFARYAPPLGGGGEEKCHRAWGAGVSISDKLFRPVYFIGADHDRESRSLNFTRE